MTKSGDHVNVLPRSQECGGPQWQFGMNAYMVDPRGNGDVVVAYGKVSHTQGCGNAMPLLSDLVLLINEDKVVISIYNITYK